jgi:hypothetical protein
MHHDVRDLTVGGFAGPIRPDDLVRTFANGVHPRRRSAGAFAGDPGAHRQGSFADSDRLAVLT